MISDILEEKSIYDLIEILTENIIKINYKLDKKEYDNKISKLIILNIINFEILL
jgi:hypothetical protein